MCCQQNIQVALNATDVHPAEEIFRNLTDVIQLKVIMFTFNMDGTACPFNSTFFLD